MHPSKEQIKIGNISTSQTEIIDILKAWFAISVAFAVVLSTSIFSAEVYNKFIIAALTVGIGFLLHELGHKIVAQKYGCFAEFRSFDNMLLLSIAMSFLGFVFAAPGAVMISGKVNKARNGLISAAGPIINLALSAAFFGLAFLEIPNLFKQVAYYGFVINSWLALFNMIPFWLFDGYKVWRWNKLVYAAIVLSAILLMFAKRYMPL